MIKFRTPLIYIYIAVFSYQVQTLRHLKTWESYNFLNEAAKNKNSSSLNAEQKLHQTRLDHFRLRSKQTFNLRYWEDQSYWFKEEGPIFLYLCGEWTCSYSQAPTFYGQIAQSHQANILVLQHRYYGDSQPFSDWSLDNLRYLSVNQALADIAHFIQAKNSEWGRQRKWIVVGGSYPGALSAWFRYKYPHLTVGAWSSSGVVQAITNFTQFDGQVRDDLFKSGYECLKMAQSITQQIQNSLPGVKGMFQAPNDMPNDEFMWFIADVISLSSQYGHRTQFCEYLEKKLHTISDLAAWAVKSNIGWEGYASSVTKSTTIDINKSMRQWYYQMCSEMGFMQPGSNVNPVRSKLIDLEPFWRQYCKRIFNDDVWPDDKATNTEHGGNKVRVRNLIMMNGSEDPWKWASIVKKTKQTNGMKTWLIECNDCGHCTDLRPPAESDDKNLKKVRQLIADEINEWLK